MAASKFSVQSFDLKHYSKTEAYARAVQALFESATRDIMHMKQIGSFDPDKPFRWEDYPQAKAIMEQITLQLATRVVGTIERGSRDEWVSSCKKNDAYLEHIMNTSKLSKQRLAQMQDRRLEALDAFQARKVNGLDLSQRVWKYVNQYKQNLEDGIDLGLGVGSSADVLSREVRKYLADPDMYFRRFRVKVGTDENGQTVYGRKWKRMIKTPDGNVRWIDEAPQDYHPGAGKYRSSYKNAMRLARSEINMAYRESDWERWQQLDFVVGFEIHRSNHRPEYKCKLCERLKGRYPKNFKFVGWHPHCRCYVTPIIMDDETFNNNEVEDLRAALRGTEAKHDQAKNAVVKMPDNFTEWAKETADKIANGEMHIKNMPYFVRDNFVGGDIERGIKPDVEQYDPLMSLSEAQSIVEQAIAVEVEKLKSKPDSVPVVEKTKGVKVAERAKNILDAIDVLFGSRGARDAYNVGKYIQYYKGNDRKITSSFDKWAKEDVLHRIRAINHLEELFKATDTAKIPEAWRKAYNEAITKINSADIATDGYFDIYAPIEEAYNIYKLSTNKLAVKYGLDKLSRKTPYQIVEKCSTLEELKESLAPKEMYESVGQFVPMCGKDAAGTHYNPATKAVHIEIDEARFNACNWYRRSVQCHEFGHSKDALNGSVQWCHRTEWKDLFKKFSTVVNKDGGLAMEKAVRDKRAALGTSITQEQSEQIGKLEDTLQALVKGHRIMGCYSHPVKYWKGDAPLKEFIAHASECYYVGNPMFEELFPDLYKEMCALMKTM